MESKRVLIAAGGTGGHIYPAVALAKKLQLQGIEVLFVGGGLSKNRYFEQHTFPFKEITCGFLSTKNPFKLMRGGFNLLQGAFESWKILREFQPKVVIGFGSFYTAPMLFAAKLTRYPIVLHEQNAIPGRVNRLFSKYADFTAISIPDASKYLSGVCLEVEMPMRGESAQNDPANYFELDPDRKTLLIFGGSQGAEAINRCLLEAVPQLNNYQFLHFTGDPTSAKSASEQYKKIGAKACVKPFETRMDLAWKMADFAVARAGAGTVAEAVEYGVPTLFIPFPFAMDNHQEKNADFMVENVGGGCKILQKDLQTDLFVRTVQQAPIDAMKEAIKHYKKNRDVRTLEALILEKYI